MVNGGLRKCGGETEERGVHLGDEGRECQPTGLISQAKLQLTIPGTSSRRNKIDVTALNLSSWPTELNSTLKTLRTKLLGRR